MTITRPAPNSHAQRAAIGVGHPHVFGLAAIVAAGGVRVAEDPAECGGLRVRLVAVPEQPLLAEMAAAAGDVERDQHVVADGEIGHAGADFLNNVGEFVAERQAHAGIRHHPVVQVRSDPQMQVRVTRTTAS